MIEMKQVSFAYHMTDAEGNSISKPALRDINLNIKSGEFVVLTGGSGCGKTTVCRLINGLIPHYFEGALEGDVLLDGASIASQPIYETAKQVGSVFQNPRSQFFNVDTTSELAFAAENQGREPEQIKKDIAQVTSNLLLETLLGRSMFALSGGEKQKIACGSVAVADTDVVVLDEPSSNLDTEGIESLRKTLALWKNQGKTIIIAEHRLFFLRELADRTLIFQEGQVIRELDAETFKTLTVEECASHDIRAVNLHTLVFRPVTVKKSDNILLKNIHFNYTKDHGVNISDSSFPGCSVTAIIGQNGAGKSTLARTLCGLNKRARGTVSMDGEDIPVSKMLPYCYMVMQDVNHQLFTDSVLEEVQISIPQTIPEEKKDEKARNALRLLDMEKMADIHPMALSGGQKQRVAIASAIAADKKILIFDEPTSGLDHRHMCQTAEVLKMLRNMGKTILVITHDIELIEQCVDYVICMKHGSVSDGYTMDENGIAEMRKFFSI